MKGEQQKILHKGLNSKINVFITLLYPSNRIKFKITKSRNSKDFVNHLKGIKSYLIRNKVKRFIPVIPLKRRSSKPLPCWDNVCLCLEI
jgi:hypothetical protein